MQLIEENSARLKVLEKEWKEAGLICPIEFVITCRLRFNGYENEPESQETDELAEQFSNFLSEKGYLVYITLGRSDERKVVATKLTEQTPESITRMQESLLDLASVEESVTVEWGVPEKEEVKFYYDDPRSNRGSLKLMEKVLFGQSLVKDLLNESMNYTSGVIGAKHGYTPAVFRIKPSDFLQRADEMRIKNPDPTVSGFSQWVYGLYASANGTEEDKEKGREVEASIFEKHKSFTGSIDNLQLKKDGSPWRLVHSGLQSSFKQKDYRNYNKRPDYFGIPQLKVGGKSLRGSPNLVYLNSSDSKAIIVEIKYSRLPIPTNLWPNIWAQLWCYSHVHLVDSSKSVTVIGEVWGDQTLYMRRASHIQRLCLRSSVRRNPRAPAYDKFFRRLFEIYSGN